MKDVRVFLVIFKVLKRCLSKFGLEIGMEKTFFIRFGPDSDKLPDSFVNPEKPTERITVSPFLKFLGYFIQDAVNGLSIEFHLMKRTELANPWLENQFLTYVKKSLKFSISSRRIFFMNR
jgi:hypothetical protein